MYKIFLSLIFSPLFILKFPLFFGDFEPQFILIKKKECIEIVKKYFKLQFLDFYSTLLKFGGYFGNSHSSLRKCFHQSNTWYSLYEYFSFS